MRRGNRGEGQVKQGTEYTIWTSGGFYLRHSKSLFSQGAEAAHSCTEQHQKKDWMNRRLSSYCCAPNPSGANPRPIITIRSQSRQKPMAANPTFIRIMIAHRLSTRTAVDDFLILLVPAMAARPIINKATSQMLKTSSEDAIALSIGEESDGSRWARFVATRLPEREMSRSFKLSVSRTAMAAAATRAYTSPTEQLTQANTDRILL